MNEPNGHSPSNGHSASGPVQAGVDPVQTGVNGNENGHVSVPVNWEHLARSTAHPLRISILEILGMDGGRTLSPSELSQELQIPLSNTNYHVTELAKARLIDPRPPAPGPRRHRALLPAPGRRRTVAGRGGEKRTTGLEPATSSLGSSRSTN